MKRMLCLGLILVLCLAFVPANAAQYASLELSDDQRGAASLFLSNFTEIGYRELGSDSTDTYLVDFANDHLWFNNHDVFEYGEYADGNNWRIADDHIQRVIEDYFYDPHFLFMEDLSQTHFDYADGYYYRRETGGFTPDGFAYVTSLNPIGDDMYFVSFMVFGAGYDYDNSVMGMSLDEIESQFGHPNGYGSALIHAEDLADRATYKMISFGRI